MGDSSGFDGGAREAAVALMEEQGEAAVALMEEQGGQQWL